MRHNFFSHRFSTRDLQLFTFRLEIRFQLQLHVSQQPRVTTETRSRCFIALCCQQLIIKVNVNSREPRDLRVKIRIHRKRE